MSDKENTTSEGTKLYELGFNLVPTITEDNLDTEYAAVKTTLEKAGATLATESKPAMINLAYTMVRTVESKKQKYDKAYFGWVKFNAEVETVEKVKAELDLNESVLRFMITKATAEGDVSSEEVARMTDRSEEEEPEKRGDRRPREVVKEKKEVKEVKDVKEEVKVEEKPKTDIKEVDKAIDELVA
jgi:ribosomal protein S6